MGQPSAETIRLIERLVAFDTTSRNSNLDLIDFVEAHLKAIGVESTLTFDGRSQKANLLATIGPHDRPGIVLSGHTDVVPVDGQNWDTDPFNVRESGGLLFGRGTCDMKSFIAVVLSRAEAIMRSGPKTPIHVALSYDEEVGCLGVPDLIADLTRKGLQALACIVGEPTEMQVAVAHKGKAEIRCTVHGREAHSSLVHKGANAIEASAELIRKLKQMARRVRQEGPFDPELEPSYTTMQTGTIAGGIATNIIPKLCQFEFEIRPLPGASAEPYIQEIEKFAADVVAPDLQSTSEDTGISWQTLSHFPALRTDRSHPVVALVSALGQTNRTCKLSFGTEAGLFSAAGIPTVVMGPGSIEQAHRPNEFISLEQVSACELFIDQLTERAAMDPRIGFPALLKVYDERGP